MRRRLTISAAIDDYLAVRARRERSWSLALLLLLLTAGNLFSPGQAGYAADPEHSGIVSISGLLLALFATISLMISAPRLSITSNESEPETEEEPNSESEPAIPVDSKTAEDVLRRVRRYDDIPGRWKGLYPFLW